MQLSAGFAIHHVDDGVPRASEDAVHARLFEFHSECHTAVRVNETLIEFCHFLINTLNNFFCRVGTVSRQSFHLYVDLIDGQNTLPCRHTFSFTELLSLADQTSPNGTRRAFRPLANKRATSKRVFWICKKINLN